MARISSHLPRLGALVLAVAVAAVAYSVYDSGKSTGSDGGSLAPQGAGLLATADSSNGPAVAPKPQSGRDSKGKAAPAPISGGAPGPGGALLRPVAFHPSVSAPGSQPKPEGGNGVDRELQRLIYRPGPKTEPTPRSPKPTPRSPKPMPRSPKPIAPAPTPKPGSPGGGVPPPHPTQPGSRPATPTDPEAGLDDLPVGGLDDTDLGEPVDEPATTPATNPAPAPTDPEAGLDDTAGGGLDQTDLGEPVDETGTG